MAGASAVPNPKILGQQAWNQPRSAPATRRSSSPKSQAITALSEIRSFKVEIVSPLASVRRCERLAKFSISFRFGAGKCFAEI